MRVLKWFGGILGVYVTLIVLFETVLLGALQPDFANQLSDCASGFIQRSKGDEKSHITEEEFTETFTLFKTI